MTHPADFRHRVLFAVSGLSPQIITETVYALARTQTPPFVPTRIVVMTTTEGANRVRLLLQSREPGWLASLCSDHDLPPISFGPEDLRIVPDRDGTLLEDIRSGEDNVDAANAIVATIAELTRDPETALHVSVAGGRKTMGFFAGYALSLYGREQDRMSHVLVSPEYEMHPEFFYPTPYPRVINTRDHGPRDCFEAKVSLADLPFVRMRGGLPDALRTGRTTYAEAVDAVQGRMAPPRLVIALDKREVIAGKGIVDLEPALFAFYVWLARKAKAGQPWVAKRLDDGIEKRMRDAREYLYEYGKLVVVAERDTTNDALGRTGMEIAFFAQKVAKLNKVLRKLTVDPDPERYQVARRGRRMAYSWGLGLPADAITIIE